MSDLAEDGCLSHGARKAAWLVIGRWCGWWSWIGRWWWYAGKHMVWYGMLVEGGVVTGKAQENGRRQPGLRVNIQQKGFPSAFLKKNPYHERQMSKQQTATYLIPLSSIKEAAEESSVKNGRNTIWPQLPSPSSVEVSGGDFTGTKGEILVTFLAFGYFIPLSCIPSPVWT